MTSTKMLRVEERDGRWWLAGLAADRFTVVNDYLGYLADRNYSPGTIRAYAFDLLAFTRWLVGEDIAVDAVGTDTLLRFMTHCRTVTYPGRPGGNVYSIRDGRNTGYAPATINRRLAAISGLFDFQQMRDPAAGNPVPAGRRARRTTAGERSGLLGHLAKPRSRSRLRVREPRRLPRGLDRTEVTDLVGSFRTVRDRTIAGLMLLSGLRSAEVLGLQISDVDIPRGWVRVIGKGDKERRVPVDAQVAGLVQTYLLVERPDTDSRALFVVVKGEHRGQPLTPAGLRTIFRYHRSRAGVPAGHPHALRHTFGTTLEANAGLQLIMAKGRWRNPRTAMC